MDAVMAAEQTLGAGGGCYCCGPRRTIPERPRRLGRCQGSAERWQGADLTQVSQGRAGVLTSPGECFSSPALGACWGDSTAPFRHASSPRLPRPSPACQPPRRQTPPGASAQRRSVSMQSAPDPAQPAPMTPPTANDPSAAATDRRLGLGWIDGLQPRTWRDQASIRIPRLWRAGAGPGTGAGDGCGTPRWGLQGTRGCPGRPPAKGPRVTRRSRLIGRARQRVGVVIPPSPAPAPPAPACGSGA